MRNPIFLALDTPEVQTAENLLVAVGDLVGGVKIGLEFFIRHGLAETQRVSQFAAKAHRPWFLDLKFFDIPNTVAGAVRSASSAKPDFLTVHCSGGLRMMRAAADSLASVESRPKLLGVTGLTSLETPEKTVLAHASAAYLAGLEGVVCSARHTGMLRAAMGPDFVLMVPGIREFAPLDDQVNIATPVEAMHAGADFLVIGREISTAASPRSVVEYILSRLEAWDLTRSGTRQA